MTVRLALAAALIWAAAACSAAVAQGSVASTGMHLNHPDTMGNWPKLAIGTLRLWDSAWGGKGESFYDIEATSPITDPTHSPNWSGLDSLITNFTAHNVTTFNYTFGNMPTWCQPSNNTGKGDPCTNAFTTTDYTATGWSPTAPATINPTGDPETFMTALFTRYKGKVAFYEPLNEPCGGEFWSPCNGLPYLDTQTVAWMNWFHDTMVSIDPNAQMISPAWSGGIMEVDDFYGAEGFCSKVAYDNFHAYQAGDEVFGNNVEQLLYVDHLHRQMTQALCGAAKPLMWSEGSFSPTPPFIIDTSLESPWNAGTWPLIAASDGISAA